MRFFCSALVLLVITGCAHRSRRTEAAPTRATTRLAADDGTCMPLLEADRALLLSIADPLNYPGTRYRKGPNLKLGTEIETDCSHFVHEVFTRAGLPYSFHPTDDMIDAPEFERIKERNAQPGDILVIHGRHMGIIDETGKLISATRTYRRRRPSSITRFDLSNFRRLRGTRYVLRYRCRPLTAGTLE